MTLTFDPMTRQGRFWSQPTCFHQVWSRSDQGVAKNSYLTFDPSDLDLSKNETLKDTSGVNLDPPTKFHEDRTKDLGGEEEQTNRQTLLEL